MGSTPQEREYGYKLDETRGSSAARDYQWFNNETRHKVSLKTFYIDKTPVTQQQYQAFVEATSKPPPFVSAKLWASYGLVHPYHSVKRFLWKENHPPQNRTKHPVVLVSHADAQAYCQSLGKHLPTEAQWEKAARGDKGLYFPWGNRFEPKRLNSQDNGPYDTLPVGQFSDGASPYKVLDMAGQVFEWTATACNNSTYIVKGGSWDDYPGVTRAAARHCRPSTLKHILIGFRCAID